jgi:hypothetical protein
MLISTINRVLFALFLGVTLLVSPFSVVADELTASIPIKYSLKQDGQVSLLITNEKGNVVRELLHAAPRKQGEQKEEWDGKDMAGKPAPAGKYTWKMLQSDGLKSEYLMSLGTTAVPAWKQMPGNHNGVSSVAVDNAGKVYLSAGCSEGPPQIVKQSVDGKVRDWDVAHVFDGWSGGVSAAVIGSKLYNMEPNGVIIVVDGNTGKRVNRWELWWDKADKGDASFGMLGLIDLAGRGNELVMSHKLHNAIRWIDPETGKVIDEAPVPSPQAIAVANDGKIFVLSNDGVVALTRTDKKLTTIIPEGTLTSGYRMDVCPLTGDILIAERGDSQQIKRFTGEGKLIQTLGRKGGRLQGAYEPKDFRTVFDITTDGAGGFFICEAWDAPRRTARFDRDGKLLADWFGGQMYANHAVADPEDPTIMWVDSHFGSIIKAKVDYVTHTWKILATYTFGGMAEGFIPSTTHGGGRFVVRHHDGKTYLCRDDDPIVLCVDEANRRLVPLVASDPILVHGWDSTPKIVKQATYPTNDPAKPFPTPGWDAFGHRGWMWTDTNGDGQPAVDEISFGKFLSWFTSRWYVDEKMNYVRYCDGALQTMPLLEWKAASVPVYAGWDGTKPISATMPDWIQATKGDYSARGRIGCVGIWPDGAGGWFAAFNDGNKPFGMGYMSSRVGANRVVRWDKDGKLLWDVGLHSVDFGVKPGEGRSFFRTVGVAHGCVAVTDIECYYNVKNLVHVWDKDGLWVGRLLENPDLKAAPAEAYTLCTENFGGALIEITPEMKVPGLKAGDVIFMGSGQNDTRVYKITGWETMKRQTGEVIITPEFAATITASVEKEAKRTDVAHIERVDFSAVDGDLKKWQKTKPLTINIGEKELAKLYLGWNSQGLFACFDVTTEQPWRSKSSPQEAFTGGAAVDINIGPLLPIDRKKPVIGDVRFVASLVGENSRTALVEYLPYLLKEMNTAKKPITFKTEANGKVDFEYYNTYPKASNVVIHRVKEDNKGYIVEMKLPLRTPLKPEPGIRFKFDASVILADTEGRNSEARIPWHSQSADDQLVTADQVIEATLRPANWGEGVLE